MTEIKNKNTVEAANTASGSAAASVKAAAAAKSAVRGTAKKKVSPAVKARKRQDLFRLIVQIIFFILAPSVYNAAFSAVKNLFTAFGEGAVIEMTGFVVQFLIVIGFTFVWGRFFCGWCCAFGALGDWVYRISQAVQKKIKKKLPALKEDQVHLLQRVKYLVLAVILLLCFVGKSSIVNQNSPWTVFSLLRAGHFDLSGRSVGVVLLILILLGMAWKERFFCQFLCPMGAVFTMVPEIPFFGLRRKKENCPAKCGACHKNCPVDLFIDTETAREGECIRCGRCSGICPKGNLSTMGGRFKGNELVLDGIKAVVLLALILILS